MSQELLLRPGYNQFWQAPMVVAVDEASITSPGQLGLISIGLTKDTEGEAYLDVGYLCGDIDEIPTGKEAVLSYGSDDANIDGVVSVNATDLPEAIGVRMAYDPDTRTVRTYYDLDADQADGEWTLLNTYTIDGSTVSGAQTLDWNLFFIEINGHSSNKPILAGQAWADDFRLNVGTTAQSEDDNRLLDDFNDDHLEPLAGRLWEMPQADLGSPVFVDTNHRRELIVASGSGEHEIRQAVDPRFYPRYDQAFELKVEAHCLPSGLAAADEVAAAEIEIVNTKGTEEHILLSVAALHNGASVDPLLAILNSAVLPMDDEPDRIDPMLLPEIVGVRITWDPATKILSCHIDTDGDRTVETWTLYADYTLDGSNQGTFRASDWGMDANPMDTALQPSGLRSAECRI